MTALFDSLATEVFQILKGSGRTLSLFDVHGTKVFDPSQARRMFAEPDKMMVGINEDGLNSAVQMSISAEADLESLAKIIDTLRNVSTRYNVLFNVRKYGRELTPKDFAFMAEPVTESNHSESIFESMWGSTKTSYQQIGSAKLIVRHSAPVKEFVGARGRNINALFVETRHGERFRFPVIHLTGARAFAQHMNQGGAAHDSFSEHIVEMARESSALAGVSRHIFNSRNQLDESALSVRSNIRERLSDLRHSLGKIARERGYSQYMESFTPAVETIQESHNDALLRECNRLADLLAINENHALADCLMPVAHLTMGENTMASDNTSAFKRSRIAFESADAADLFMETMESEFGYSGDQFVRTDNNFVVNHADVFENAKFFLEGIDGVQVSEDPEDKFLMYARKWTGDRLKKAGEPAVGPDADKNANALATGLKMLVAGRLDIHPAAAHMPKFADKNAELGFKLGLLLEPKAGLNNDALFNFISSLADTLSHGGQLSSNEQFFATRAAAVVDKSMSKVESVDRLPEMAELEQWYNGIGQVDEEDLSGDPAAMADFNKRVGDSLDAVDTNDHASMVNGDDVEEAYYDIAHKVANMLKYSDSQYNLDHGDEQKPAQDWYNQILDNWDAFTKLVRTHMGMNEGELDEMDRFQEPQSTPDVAEQKIWDVVDQEIHNAMQGLKASDFDDAEQMAHFVADKVWGGLQGWWDPTGDGEDQRAYAYLEDNSAEIAKQIQQGCNAVFGTNEAVVDESEDEFDGTAHLNAVGDKMMAAVDKALGDHPEGVSAETACAAALHALSQEEIDIMGGPADILDLIKHEREDRIKNHARDHKDKAVDECDMQPEDVVAPPAEDFVQDVTATDDEDAATLARLRQLAGV